MLKNTNKISLHYCLPFPSEINRSLCKNHSGFLCSLLCSLSYLRPNVLNTQICYIYQYTSHTTDFCYQCEPQFVIRSNSTRPHKSQAHNESQLMYENKLTTPQKMINISYNLNQRQLPMEITKFALTNFHSKLTSTSNATHTATGTATPYKWWQIVNLANDV